MKLLKIEKKEILEDAKNIKRRKNFRKGKEYKQKMSPEEYILWLEQILSIKQYKKRKIVNYKNVKI